MSFEEFIKIALYQGHIESYRDLRLKRFGFFDGPREACDMSYHVQYGNISGQPSLIGEKHRNYYGAILSGATLGLGIGAEVSGVIPSRELGRGAKALQSALRRVPGFTSIELILRKFRGV